MTSTYTYSGDPSSSPLDETRFLLSDTGPPWLFSDEEINYALEKNNNDPMAAASSLALAKASYYIRRGSISIDGISLDYGARGQAMLDLSSRLEKEANKQSAGPPVQAGGIDKVFDATVLTTPNDYPSVFDKLDYPQ